MSKPLPIRNPFVGRKREQQAYQQLLAQTSPWVLVITGQGGIGKSTLLRYLAEHTPQEITVVTLNFANESLRTDPLKILEDLSWKLAGNCELPRVDAFDKALAEGRNKLAELSKQMSQVINVGNTASLQDANLTMSGPDPATLREQRRQVRETVTRALYTQVLTFQPAHFVLMLDTCEWLSEPEGLEVGKWIMDELLPGIRERVMQKRHRCSVVIASRVSPPLAVIEKQDCYPLTLPMLEPPAVNLYLEQVGMHDAVLRQRVYDITHGHALCVSIIGTLWQEQGDRPFTLADLPRLQEKFSERALLEFIQDWLDKRLKPPFKELTRYGVLLRSFDLPMLQAVFPKLLPDAEALDLFRQLTSYPYIESLGNGHYAIHDLLREIQAAEVRDQQPDKWREYHKRALDYLRKVAPRSPDRYYHAIAYDEEQGMSDWWNAVIEPRNYETTYLGALFQAAYDVTLKLTPAQEADRAFLLGRFYYSGYGVQLDVALECYKEALSLHRQVGSKLGEANVRKAMGDVQQFRKEMQAALASYEEALGLFRQVGDRSGEANCYIEQGRIALQQEDYQKALNLHNNAYQLYQQIQDKYSQARLLYYRSFVYEAMNEPERAIQDAEKAVGIAQSLDLPFIDIFQRRLDELRGRG